MKRKKLISIAVIIIMLLNCISPVFRVYATESGMQTITLNSELYTAVSTYMKSNYTGFAYNDLLRTITASTSNFNDVTTLSLKSANISDISGLDTFARLKTLDLSGNYLSLDSNLETINNLSSLETLDLSSNNIDGFSWLNLNSLKNRNFQNQTIESVKVISVESKYDDNGNEKSEYNRDIAVSTEGLLSEFQLNGNDLDVNTYIIENGTENKTIVDSNIMDYKNKTVTLKDVYTKKEEGKMYNITAEVTRSSNEYYQSKINVYYIVIDENQEGITFKDENLYNAVKTKKQKREKYEEIIRLDEEEYGPAPRTMSLKELLETSENFPENVLKNWKENPITTGEEMISYITEQTNASSENYNLDISRTTIITDYTGNYEPKNFVYKYSVAVYETDDDMNAIYERQYNSTPQKLKETLNEDSEFNEITSNEFIGVTLDDMTYFKESEKNYKIKKFYYIQDGYIIEVEQESDLEEIGLSECYTVTVKEIHKDIQEYEPEYSGVYDKALTIVVDKEMLWNDLKEVTSDNKKIKDLTGLDKLTGLETEFSAKSNYINSIDKILDLEKNKTTTEEEIRGKIGNEISKISTAKSGINDDQTVNYLEMMKNYLDEKESIEKEISELENKTDKQEADINRITELEKRLKKLKEDAENATKKISKIFKKIDKIKNEADNMATIQTNKLYEIKNVDSLKDKAKAQEILREELNNLSNLEKDKALNSYDSVMILLMLQECGFQIASNEAENELSFENVVKFTSSDQIESLNLSTIKEIFNGIKEFDSKITNDILNKDYCNGTNYKINECYAVAKRLTQNNTQEMLKSVISLPRLKKLDLSDNNIESIEKIDELTKLEVVDVSKNSIKTIENVDWAKLTKLKELSLANNQISDIDKLKDLGATEENQEGHLRKLDVSNCLLSGKFNFDFIKLKIENVNFAGNSYSDLSYLINEYSGEVRKNRAKSFADYLDKMGYICNFAGQVIKINCGNCNPKNNETLVFNLPAIFANIEEMDPYNTSFGIVPMDGNVEKYGKTVSFLKYSSGLNTGVVRIDTNPVVSEDTRKYDDESVKNSIGVGTTCYIKYNVGNLVETPTDPNESTIPGNNETQPSEERPNNNEDLNINNNPNNSQDEGTNKATVENVLMDEYNSERANYIYVYEPGITVKSLAELLDRENDREIVEVKKINKSENYSTDLSKLYTTELVELLVKTKPEVSESDDEIASSTSARKQFYEIVVMGDIDGDGDIDSIDSGYARALKYGTLYKDIEDESKSIALMNAFKETANYRAADMNVNDKVDTKETSAILYYRAGLLNDFKAFIPNN